MCERAGEGPGPGYIIVRVAVSIVTGRIPCMLISMRAYRNSGFIMHTHLQYVIPCGTADVMVSDQDDKR